MTQDVHCGSSKKNPELFHLILRNAVEEIAGGTSNMSATKRRKPHEQATDVFQMQEEMFHSDFEKAVLRAIDEMWDNSDIPPKTSFLNELEAKYPADFVAWRPTAGEVPFLSLRGNYLTNTKERLLYKIRSREIESESLKKTLLAKATALQKCLTTISAADDYVSQIRMRKNFNDDS